MADCCKDAENLNVPEAFRTGTGALRQECLMHSRLSAPQIPCWQHGICPVRNVSGPLRFSRLPTDARQTHRATAQALFLAFGIPSASHGFVAVSSQFREVFVKKVAVFVKRRYN